MPQFPETCSGVLVLAAIARTGAGDRGDLVRLPPRLLTRALYAANMAGRRPESAAILLFFSCFWAMDRGISIYLRGSGAGGDTEGLNFFGRFPAQLHCRPRKDCSWPPVVCPGCWPSVRFGTLARHPRFAFEFTLSTLHRHWAFICKCPLSFPLRPFDAFCSCALPV